MRISVLVFGPLLLAACNEATPPAAPAPVETPDRTSDGGAPAPVAAPRLEPLFLTEGFAEPEGVAAHPDGGWFISSVGGDAADKDGNGYVSRIGPDGAVVTARFAEGLDAPKGMAVLDGRLYATDIDRVRIIDAATGASLGDIAIEGASFLNDATVWQGAVFVSDSRTARIHRLADGAASVWREGEDLRGVNGLLGVGDRLYVSTMSGGDLFEAASDGGWRRIATGMANADGIGVVSRDVWPGGGWLVSSWPGQIHYVAEDGAVTTLLDRQADGVLQNDLSVFGDTVIVPNMRPGTLTGWRIVR